MKRTLLFVALTAIGATSAMAQSNVSITGRLHMSVESQKDFAGDSVTVMDDNGSRLQFSGTEDLGGGLKASFLLDHRLSADTGTANSTFWAGESWVGVESGFGKVRLGNMGQTDAYFATADYIGYHNHDSGSSADKFYLAVGDAKNMIAYTSPSFGGLVVSAQIGLKEGGAITAKNTTVLAANYDAGPLHVGVGYADASNTVPVLVGLGFTTHKQFGVRAAYDLGPLTVGAYFINDKADQPGVSIKRNAYRFAAMYTMGKAELHANFGVAGDAEVNGADFGIEAKQFTLAYNYNLSKRTKLFAFYTKFSGDGAATYSAVESSLAAGVRHNF